MMNFISKLIFIFTLISGTLITLSSSSWIGMWMGLELNLLSFIPLMISPNNLTSTESSIKYFLVQAMASLVFLFSSIIYITKLSYFFPMIFSYENLIINSAMMLKLGAAPFHFWFPNIIDGLSWLNSLILLTWQKLAPLTVISYTSFNMTIFMFIIFSALIGALGGLNQTSLRKIMAFSSINHISWLLISELFMNSLWLLYFCIYTILNLSIISMFKIFNIFHMNQIFLFKNNQLIFKSCLLMNFLSLGGLPPFLGFLPKWMVIENLIKSKMFFLMFFMIMMALITLFFYIRLTFSAFLISYQSFSWSLFNYMNKNLNLNLLILLNLISNVLFFLLLMNNFLLT